MRQYKAKLIDTRGWVRGWYWECPMSEFSYIKTLYRKNYAEGYPIDLRVDPSTVCQSTGLFDKNGVEIFEGDYVIERHSEGQQLLDPYLVIWDNNLKLKGKWNSHIFDVKGKYDDGKFSYNYDCEFEVVGNRWDE